MVMSLLHNNAFSITRFSSINRSPAKSIPTSALVARALIVTTLLFSTCSHGSVFSALTSPFQNESTAQKAAKTVASPSSTQGNTHNITLTWNSSQNATHYELEKLSGSTWELVEMVAATQTTVNGLSDGEHQFRVRGCIEQPGVTIHCGDHIAHASAPYTLTLPLSSSLPDAAIEIAPAAYAPDVSGFNASYDVTSAKIGLTAGQFRVDESGAATYNMPLNLPTGIAGNTPQLSLGYSSAAGNGSMGIGWSVSGLSSISRCRPTQEQDGYNLQLTLTNADRFCLDGQKLVLVSGNYGEAGATYRTEIDSRVNVTSLGSLGGSSTSPSYFTVEREDGSIWYYGANDIDGTRTDATLTATRGQVDESGNGAINETVAWHLTSISDNLRNSSTSVFFHYTKNKAGFGSNEILIDKVQYSGNTVQFHYDTNVTREDIRAGFVMGTTVENTVRMSKVAVKNHNDHLLREYRLTYEIDSESEVHRIRNIQECGDSGTHCYNATTFDWNNTLAHSTRNIADVNLGDDNIHSPLPIDINGDGLSDFVFAKEKGNNTYEVNVAMNQGDGALSNPARLFNIVNDAVTVSPIKLIPSDVDGDGLAELIFYTKVGDGFKWRYFNVETALATELSACEAYNTCNITSFGQNIVDMNRPMNMNSASKNELMLHDFNGDAYPDLVLPESRVLNDGNGQFSETAIQTNLVFAQTSNHKNPVISRHFTPANGSEGDIPELMLLSQAMQEIITNPGIKGLPLTASNTEPHCPSGTIIADVTKVKTLPSQITPSDFNGDGVADILVRLVDVKTIRTGGSAGTQPCFGDIYWGLYTLEKRLGSDGNYADEPRYELYALFPKHDDLQSQIFTGDINGDGLSDVLHPPHNNTGSGFFVYLSSGAGMSAAQSVTLGAAVEDINSVQLVDINKDGKTDIFYFDKPQKRWEVMYQQSDGSFAPAVNYYTDSSFDENRDGVFLADWDGDGEVGFVRINFNDKKLIRRPDDLPDNAPNRIHTITNGFGLETIITYALMTDSSVYEKGSGAEALNYGDGSPVFDLISPQPLVKSVSSDAPGYVNNIYDADHTLSVQYFYEGMRAQSGGRGSLGFEKVYTYDPTRNVTTETRYRQDFPFIGMPAQTRQYIGSRTDGAVTLLSDAENTYNAIVLNGGDTVFPYLDISEESTYALNDDATSSVLKTVTETDNHYVKTGGEDSHANLQSITVTTKATAGGTALSTTTTTNEYAQDYGVNNQTKWWLGRVTRTSVTHERANETAVTRASTFSYTPTGTYAGMLEKEHVINPAQLQTNGALLTTLHCYDSVGNTTKTITHSSDVTVSDCSSASVNTDNNINNVYRAQHTTFDSDNRYVLSSSNAQFTTQSVDTSGAGNAFTPYGRPKTMVNSHGVKTQYFFDAFGNEFASFTETGVLTRTQRRLSTNTFAGTPTITGLNYYYVQRTITSGAPTQYAYFDVMGRQVASATQSFESDEFTVQITGYDAYGQVVKQSVPHFHTNSNPSYTTTRFDGFNRVQQMDDASGTSTVITYADNGLSVTTTLTYDGAHQGSQTRTRTETMNRLGETVSIADESGTISYEFDATGNMDKVTGVDNVITTINFDSLGRKTSMVDANKGTWSYTYNAIGEMITQTDAKQQVTKFFRDNVGRTVERTVCKTDAECSGGIVDSVTYAFAGTPRLQSEAFTHSGASAAHGAMTQSYLYDNFGRQTLSRTTLDSDALSMTGSQTYTQQTTYDAYGRVFQQFDADGTSLQGCINNTNDVVGECWGVRFHYNAQGYPSKQEEARYSQASDASLKTVFQEVTEMDAFGHAKIIQQNNNTLTTTRLRAPETGLLTDIQTTNQSGVLIQDNDYTFDNIGTLRSRTRHTLKNTATVTIAAGANIATASDVQHSIHSQTFDYDNVNRLTHIDDTEFVRYSANGNITWKKGVGHYCYQTARPHAVSGISNQANCSNNDYLYDANGNQTQGRGRDITYGHFDKPTLISSGSSDATTFAYNTARKRFKRITTETKDGAPVTTTTYYVGNLEIIQSNGGANGATNEIRRYVANAIQTRYSNGITDTRYLLKDHIGSIDTITDQNGKILDKLYFNPWGKKVSIDESQWTTTAQDQAATTLTNVLDITTRGFTGHEHVMHADIIHMNGRIFDPTLGRFLQADPHIQAPNNSQSYNRYAYVLNNPLSYTDPSGYLFNKLFKAINKVFGDFAPFVAIAIAWWNPGALLFNSTWAAGAATGFIAGGVGTGSLRGALVGAFTGAAFGGLHNFDPGIGKTLLHGAVGGAGSVLNGGKFGHGFLSAGLTQGLSGRIDNISTKIGRITASAVVGGTVSKVTGGKFSNGAMTGAFSRALNDEGGWTSKDRQAAMASEMSYDMNGGLLEQMGIEYNPRDGFSASLLKSDDGYMLAFRGTQGEGDMTANLAQGAGLTSSQYEQAVALATDVVQATGGNVTFVGHSLGGGLASAAANATGGQAITFNAAGVSPRYNTGTHSGIRAHIIRGDILSGIQNSWIGPGPAMPNTIGTRIYHNPLNLSDTALDRHSIGQFTGR